MPGKGKLIITSKLGEEMQESAHAAMSYVRSRAKVPRNGTSQIMQRAVFVVRSEEGSVSKRHAAVLASLSAVVSACAIPSRDNPHDPANAPAARLTLVDVTTGGVATVDLLAPWAHEIEFDATASTDSQGDIDHCVFTVVATTSGSPVGDVSEDDCRLSFHGSTFGTPLALSLSSSYAVSVRVVDRKGNFDVAPPPGIENIRRLRLTNEEPTADPGIDRTLPAGGLPWDAAQSVSLVFDGSGSSDADGPFDAAGLSYCWTITSEGNVGAETCGADASLSIDVVPATYMGNSLTARLRVRDPLGAISRARIARVAFRSLNIWVIPSGTGAVERMDSLHRTGTWGGSNASIPVAELPGSGQVVIVGDVEGDLDDDDSRDNTFHVVYPPLPKKSASPPAAGINLAGTAAPGDGSGLGKLAADPRPAEQRVWLRSTHAPSASPDFQTTDLTHCTGPCSYLSSYIVDAGGGVTAERLVDIPLALSDQGDRDGGRLFVDEEGAVFASNGLGAQIVVLEESGTVVDDLLGAASNVIATAIAPRPGTNETWILISHGLDPSAAEPAELFIYNGSTLLRSASVDDEVFPFGIGWIDANEFWVGRPGTGMTRVNAEIVSEQAFTGTVRLDDARVQVVPEISDIGSMIADRVTGDVWFSGLSGEFARVSPAGIVTNYDAGSDNSLPAFVDSVGALWLSPRGTLTQAFAPSLDGVAANLGVRPGNMVEYDWETGGVWFPVAIPPAIVNVSEDGTVLRYENDVVIDGTPQYVPFTQVFRLTPGTRTGWYIGIDLATGNLSPTYRMEDVAASPLVLTQVLTAAESADIVDSGSVFEPFAPVPGSPAPARIWTVRSGAIVQIESDDGSPTGVSVALPGPEIGEAIRAARALETNDLCVATETSLDEIHLRRVSPLGAVTELATFPILPGGSDDRLAAVAATVDPSEGPLCWVAWSESGMAGESAHIRAYPSSGVPVVVYDTDMLALPLGELAVSILPIRTDDVWATFARLEDLSGTFDRPIWKTELVLATSGNPTLSEAALLEPTSGAHLAAPWTRAEQRGAFDN